MVRLLLVVQAMTLSLDLALLLLVLAASASGVVQVMTPSTSLRSPVRMMELPISGTKVAVTLSFLAVPLVLVVTAQLCSSVLPQVHR